MTIRKRNEKKIQGKTRQGDIDPHMCTTFDVLKNLNHPSPAQPSHHGTRTITFQARAPASRIAQARQLLLLLLIMAFHPRCAQMALTIISMSEPNCIFCDSRCMRAAAEKLPFLSRIGDDDGVITCSKAGTWGWSAKLVMQSITSTRFVPDLPNVGSTRNSDSDVRGLRMTSEMCTTVKL